MTARSGRNPWVVGVLGVACALIVAMWIYAFGFAPREAVNRVGDRAWAEHAETVCADARAQLVGLADFEYVADPTPDDMRRRAELVSSATDILQRMLDDLTATPPADAKGMDLVPLWEADYRTYLTDRREYVARLEGGANPQFSESQVDGIPISEKLHTFALDNEMDSCAPPNDLSA